VRSPLGKRPGEEPAGREARLERNRIALRLIAAARRGDTSEFGEEGLAEIAVPFGEDGWRMRATLRADGVVVGDGTSGPARYWTARPEEFTPEEREENRRRELAAEARRGKPKFEGVGYRRTVVAPPQPGAPLHVLAVQIFDDGFFVDFTFNVEVPTREERERDGPRRDRYPPIDVADDVGTAYYEGERSAFGGSQPSISTFNFSPTPPADATVLRITTEAGTVELDLFNRASGSRPGPRSA
jgi:hypothetical protein